MAQLNTDTKILSMLKNISLFSRLDDDHLLALAERFVTLTVPSGRRVLMQGEPVESFVVVLSGLLNVLRCSPEGRERIVATLRPAMHFGLAEMITGRGAEAAIRAEKESIIAVISKESFRKLVLGDPGLSYALMQTMARSIFTLTRQLDYVTFESAENRLIRRLLALGSSGGIASMEGTKIIPAPSHEDLAAMIGSARETVSRSLGELKKAGLIETGYRKITLKDTASMKERLERSRSDF